MRSRVATLLAIAMVAAGVGGTFAVAGGPGGPDGSAAATQYHNRHCYNRSFNRRHRAACQHSEVKSNRSSGKGKKKSGKKKSSGRKTPALAGRQVPGLAG